METFFEGYPYMGNPFMIKFPFFPRKATLNRSSFGKQRLFPRLSLNDCLKRKRFHDPRIGYPNKNVDIEGAIGK